MTPLSPLRRRASWVAGALLLALVGLPLLVAGARFGLRYWPFLLGAGAIALLLAGWLERWWQTRPLRPSSDRSRSKARRRFRLVPGGRRDDRPPALDDDDTDEPRWLM
jgi:hypothetical protein